MSTLQNFGVPQTDGFTGGILQPKLNYRFRVSVVNFGLDNGAPLILTRQVMNVTRPKLNHEEVVLDSYNSKAYIAGKHTWDPVTLVLRDEVSNGLTRVVGSQLQRQMDHRQQKSPTGGGLAGSQYKFNMFVETLDGNSTTALEVFNLEGCFIQNVDYGQTDYTSSEPLQISLTIRFDNCILATTRNDQNSSLYGTNTFQNQGSFIGPQIGPQ
jgi:hypothetical protein